MASPADVTSMQRLTTGNAKGYLAPGTADVRANAHCRIVHVSRCRPDARRTSGRRPIGICDDCPDLYQHSNNRSTFATLNPAGVTGQSQGALDGTIVNRKSGTLDATCSPPASTDMDGAAQAQAVLSRMVADARSAWVASMIVRSDSGLLAVQILRNSTMAATFFASTAVLPMIGMMTLTSRGTALKQTWQALNIIGTVHARLWLAKLRFRSYVK